MAVAELEAKEGRDAVVISEASVLEQLSDQLRCSIGTLGGGWAATARCPLLPRVRHGECHAACLCAMLLDISGRHMAVCDHRKLCAAVTHETELFVCRGDNWKHMFGAFNVWLDVHPEQDEGEAPQRGAYSAAEVHIKLDMPEGLSADDAAEEVVGQVCVRSSCHLTAACSSWANAVEEVQVAIVNTPLHTCPRRTLEFCCRWCQR